MHIKLEAVITELCTSPQRSWASGLHCSPHTSLMAIGGHYGPPMTHRLLVQAARRSPEAHTLGFSSAAAASVFFFLFCCCCRWGLFLPLPSFKHWPTAMPTLMQSVVYLQWGEIHAQTHVRYGGYDGGFFHTVSPCGKASLHSALYQFFGWFCNLITKVINMC